MIGRVAAAACFLLVISASQLRGTDLFFEGFNSFSSGECDVVGTSPTFINAAGRNSTPGMRVAADADEVSEVCCTIPSATPYRFAQFYPIIGADSLPHVGDKRRIFRVVDTNDRDGCVADLVRTESGYQLQISYQGEEPIAREFSVVPLTVGDTSSGVVSGQLLNASGPSINCPGKLNGTSVGADVFEAIATDCAGSSCYAEKVCFGASGDGPAVSIDFDDLAWTDTASKVGRGDVRSIYPSGSLLVADWSNCGGDTNQCIDDWDPSNAGTGDDLTGTVLTCFGSPTTNLTSYRTKTLGTTGDDIATMTDLSSPPGTIQGVRAYVEGCNNNTSSSTAIKLQLRINPSTTKYKSSSFTWAACAASPCVEVTDWRKASAYWLTDPSTSGAWSTAAVNNIEAGYEKTASNDPRVSAMMVDVFYQQPNIPPEEPFPDQTRCVGGANKNLACATNADCPSSTCAADGIQMIVYYCDSVIAPTAQRQCENPSNSCRETCLTASDCEGYDPEVAIVATTCINGFCRTLCETDSECSGCATDGQGVCIGGTQYVPSQLARNRWIDAAHVCARSQQTTDFLEASLDALYADPIDYLRDKCTTVKGGVAMCSNAATLCNTDSDCSGGGTCTVEILPDAITNDCGNATMAVMSTGGECGGSSTGIFGSNRTLVHQVLDRTACPMTGTGQYRRPLSETRCDNKPASYCPNTFGTSCGWVCDQDPADSIRICSSNVDCGRCSNDPRISCTWAKVCDDVGQYCTSDAGCDSGHCNLAGAFSNCEPKMCETDADCPGDCIVNPNPSTTFEYDKPSTVCGTCVADVGNPCSRYSGSGLKTCGLGCDDIPCGTDDSLCEDPYRPFGGSCNPATGVCEHCSTSVPNYYDTDRTEVVIARRQRIVDMNEFIPFHPKQILALEQQLMAEAAAHNIIWLAQGTPGTWQYRRYAAHDGTSPVYGAYLVDPKMHEAFRDLRYYRQRLPLYADTDWFVMETGIRLATYSKEGSASPTELFSRNLGDGAHMAKDGILQTSIAAAALANHVFLVCSGDESKVCSYCYIPCDDNTDCNVPGAAGSGTCSSGFCTCSNNNQCPGPNSTCVATESGVSRCLTTKLDDCPVGDALITSSGRTVKASHYRCSQASAGTCGAGGARTVPRCTKEPDTPCASQSDCTNDPRNICTPGAIVRECQTDADCLYFQNGPYVAPTCQAWPDAAAGRKVCRY